MAIFRHLKSKLILAFQHGSFRGSRLTSSFSEETDLKSVLATKIPNIQNTVKEFRDQYGNKVIDEITIDMAYGGMRNMLAIVSETSESDRDHGVRFRGYTIPECYRFLPKTKGSDQPLPESLFWLIVTGDIPTEKQVKALSKTWAKRAELPPHVVKMLNNFPSHLHPMSQFSAAVTALNTESKFQKAYACGLHKSDYWEYVYEDAMDLLGKLPTVAATIYNNLYRDGKKPQKMDENSDWTQNYVSMLGYDDHQFVEYMRLYLFSHSDHEAGNVSAHTGHLVGSALADPYLSFAAALNGLAGPLHGLAIQEVLVWLQNLQKELGEDVSTENLQKFVWKTLKSGQVVPGYGHAVLRKTDPRYLCVRDFALKNLPHDPLFQLVSRLFDIVPPILLETGKVKNPWPNADAHTGVLLQYYGMKEMSYYTVIFGVSRSLGVMANLILDRILGLPIERPKSVSTNCLRKLVEYSKERKMRV